MTSTTGVLPFDSGYTTNVSTARLSCFTVTHSRCRGDFSSAALAHSCADANGAAQRIKREIRAIRFMDVLSDFTAEAASSCGSPSPSGGGWMIYARCEALQGPARWTSLSD